MYIAQAKRKENIAEYILYLWQLEDLLRAMDFNAENIYANLIIPSGGDAKQQSAQLTWYLDMIDIMRREDILKSGHMEHTMHLIGELQELHEQLLKLPTGEEYRKLYSRVAPELAALRSSLGKENVSDVELFFRSLYAVVLYRIKGDEQHSNTVAGVIELISPVVAELSRVFHLTEQGKLDIYVQSNE